MNPDCIIVGGGIIGLMSALELRRNDMNVLVIERGQAGRESSWAGGGILSPMYPWNYPEPITVLGQWSQQLYPQLAAELQIETGIDPQLINSGMLILSHHDVRTAIQWAEDFEYRIETVNTDDIQDQLPSAPNIDCAPTLSLPDTHQIRNPRLLAALKKRLDQLGVSIITDSPIRKLLIDDNKISGVDTDRDRYASEMVLIAGGAWSGRILAQVGFQLNIKPIRGQMLLLKGEPGYLKPIVVHKNHYMIPRQDGRILVGSTLENVGFDTRITGDAKRILRNFAIRLFPELANVELEDHWSGLRPGSPHGIPTISSLENIRGLYANTGHFRNGIFLAPGSARLLADIILDRPPIVNPSPYQAAAN